MDSIAIILIVIGIVLLLAEIFIPSFGVTGLIGIISIFVGVVFTADTFIGGLLMFTIILVVTLILMYVTYRALSSMKSPLILRESLRMEAENEKLKFFLGKTGKALTPLRPAGTVDFEGVRLDVLTRGDFINKGTDVVIDEIDGKKIFVKVKD